MANTNQDKPVILRRKNVEHRTGLPRSSIYLSISQGKFPKPIKLGPRSVGWLESEIDEWLAKRIQERDRTAGEDANVR